MKHILATIMSPSRLTYFADPPAPAPAPPAPPAGSPPSDPGNADIMNFEAPDLGASLEGIVGGSSPAPAPAPAAPPAASKPGDPPKPAPAAPKPGDPPAKQLRDELERTKAELAEARATMEKGDPRLKDLETERDAIKAQIKERDDKLADYEKKLAIADPAVTKELSQRDEAWGKEAAKFFTSVPELDPRVVHTLATELHNLPFNTPEYRDARAAWEAKVNTALGAQDGAEHRKLARALEHIEKHHDWAVERPGIEKRIMDSSAKLQTEARISEYTGRSEFVKNSLAAAKEIPDALRKSDPYHAKVMIESFEKSMKLEDVTKLTAGIPEFIELAFAGPPPFREEDYVGQTPEQIAESRARQEERHTKARAAAVDVSYNGLRALRLFPALIKEIQRLREKVKDDVDTTPPDPTGGVPGAGASSDDVKNFVPDEVPDFRR